MEVVLSRGEKPVAVDDGASPPRHRGREGVAEPVPPRSHFPRHHGDVVDETLPCAFDVALAPVFAVLFIAEH